MALGDLDVYIMTYVIYHVQYIIIIILIYNIYIYIYTHGGGALFILKPEQFSLYFLKIVILMLYMTILRPPPSSLDFDKK